MVGKLQLRARTAPFPSLVTGILTLPCASLGLAAINNIRDWQVAEKKLLQPTQMSQLNPCVSLCLWRERSKVFWRMKDESTLDSFSPCINDVHKEKLPYSMRQDMTGQQISFQIYSTSDLNEREFNLVNKVFACNFSSRHPSNTFKRCLTWYNKSVLLQHYGRRKLAAVSGGRQSSSGLCQESMTLKGR